MQTVWGSGWRGQRASRIVIGAMLCAWLTGCGKGEAAPKAATNTPIVAVDTDALRSTDGQTLVVVDTVSPTIPPRPADPAALPEDSAGHWWDLEYAGWLDKKLPMPASPANGARGKKVICLRFMDHPYLTAYSRGMQQVADAYGIELKTLVANNDINIQSQQVDQAINERPDLVIILPVDAQAVVPLLRKLHQAQIPVIASNLLVAPEGMKYVLTWTGPDDWGGFRMLAAEFAKQMNYEGGYTVVRHMPGSSPFVSRTFSLVTELRRIAPKMRLLDMQTTNLQAEKSLQVVSDWITRFGPDLRGVVSGDDSGAQIGINQAVRNAGRTDIVRVAAGNSKVGMDFVLAGDVAAITYQTAEGDGALPMKLAGDWFNGVPIARPVYYLPKRVMTTSTVKSFMPAQW